MKRYIQDYVFLFSIAGSIVLLDQVSKYLVRSKLMFTEYWSPVDWLEPFVRIVHWQNTGAAFGIFQNMNTVFSILAVVVSCAILYYFPRIPRDDWTMRLALALQLGGALGNLMDRLTRGYVTDFVSVGSFAVFNVADASISIGVAILIFGVWDKERKQKKAQAAQGDLTSGAPPEEMESD